MASTSHERIARQVLEAWNTHDVERVVACYTPDLVYRDPGTRGYVQGADALRRFLWRAMLTPLGSETTLEVEGMDLVVLEGERLKRNEVYFDRAALASLVASRPAA
ncbi:MAG: nuclear transport factor 2 family protein [Deltaproteobacteria bacterium]|nr:MAG: nuclear transport factor 2 family protein [Deltaproteobacteria bacterium]